MLTLTGQEIKDLAEAVGFVVEPHDYSHELETQLTIVECPESGVIDDDGKPTFWEHVAYLTEYPDEGTYPLGNQLESPTKKKPMNADEARQITHSLAGEQALVLRAEIDQWVEKAAKKGGRSIDYFDLYRLQETARKALVKSLEDDGYTVKFVGNPDPGHPCSRPYHIISW